MSQLEKGPAKSDLTRARILDAAIGLFRRQSFESTTMREIAAEAGVAIGAAYYYFESKNAIVLAFYDRSRQEMAPLLDEAVASSRDLKGRLQAMIEVKLHYFLPNRDILAALAGRTNPADPLSPFSAQTQEIRAADIAVFAQAIAESRTKVSRDLAAHLPQLLWLYQMGIILFWIYDRSPDQQRPTNCSIPAWT